MYFAAGYTPAKCGLDHVMMVRWQDMLGAVLDILHRHRRLNDRSLVEEKLMKATLRGLLGLVLLTGVTAGQAADPVITATGAAGSPGSQALVEVIIDFDTGFPMVSQDIRFQYDPAVLNFVAANSTAQLNGGSQAWPAFVNQLRGISGSIVMENLNDGTVEPGRKGYALSFVGEVERAGQMRLGLSFDILAGAALGITRVTFNGSSLGSLANEVEGEYFFPSAFLSPAGVAVNVTAVPEPSQLILLLAGLGLVSVAARRLGMKS